MEPYLHHKLRRIRQWAKYEIKQSEEIKKKQIRRHREEREY